MGSGKEGRKPRKNQEVDMQASPGDLIAIERTQTATSVHGGSVSRTWFEIGIVDKVNRLGKVTTFRNVDGWLRKNDGLNVLIGRQSDLEIPVDDLLKMLKVKQISMPTLDEMRELIRPHAKPGVIERARAARCAR